MASTETIRLIRYGQNGGKGVWRGGEEIIILYLSLHGHHQNGSCIEMGCDESHFKVSLIVMDKVTRPQLLKRKESRSKFEPKSSCLLA